MTRVSSRADLTVSKHGASHTPGPWLTKPGDSLISVRASAEHGGDRIADVGSAPYWKKFTETDEANARLIAAAPEMYEAILTTACPGGGWNGMPKELEGCCTVRDCVNAGTCGCDLGAAIAKAECRNA